MVTNCLKECIITGLTSSDHHLVKLGFEMELRMPSLNALKFDGHFISGRNISPFSRARESRETKRVKAKARVRPN